MCSIGHLTNHSKAIKCHWFCWACICCEWMRRKAINHKAEKNSRLISHDEVAFAVQNEKKIFVNKNNRIKWDFFRWAYWAKTTSSAVIDIDNNLGVVGLHRQYFLRHNFDVYNNFSSRSTFQIQFSTVNRIKLCAWILHVNENSA